jgi:hypothetical protein
MVMPLCHFLAVTVAATRSCALERFAAFACEIMDGTAVTAALR